METGMEKITLYGENVIISDGTINQCDFVINKLKEISNLSQKLGDEYASFNSLDVAIKNLPTLKEKYFTICSKIYINYLREKKIIGYDYSANDFLDDNAGRFIKFDQACDELLSMRKAIMQKTIADKQKREIRKETRGRLVGGGFGIKGAIEGIAIAETFNMLTGAAHSLYNMIDEAFANETINEQLEEIYETGRNSIEEAFSLDMIEMMYVYCEYIKTNLLFNKKEIKKALNIKNAIDEGEVPDCDLKEQVINVLLRLPFDRDIYAWAYILLGSDNGQLIKYANLMHNTSGAKRVEYFQNLQDCFGDDYLNILKTYGNTTFFANIVGEPKQNIFDTLTNIGRTIYALNKKIAITRMNSDFDKIEKDFIEFLSDYDYSLDKDEKIALIFDIAPCRHIVITNKNIYTNKVSMIKTSLSSIKDIPVKNGCLALDGIHILEPDCSNKTWNTLISVFVVLILKVKYSLGVKKEDLQEKQEKIETFDNEVVDKFIKKIKREYNFKNAVYIKDESSIANEKIRDATNEYASTRKGEIPLICYDDTAMGGAEDGFLLTTRGIYVHNDEKVPKYFPYKKIKSIKFDKLIYINEEIVYARFLEEEEKRYMTHLINDVKNYFTEESNEQDYDVAGFLEKYKAEFSNTLPSDVLNIYTKEEGAFKLYINEKKNYSNMSRDETPLFISSMVSDMTKVDNFIVTDKAIRFIDTDEQRRTVYIKDIQSIQLCKDGFFSSKQVRITTKIFYTTKGEKVIATDGKVYLLDIAIKKGDKEKISDTLQRFTKFLKSFYMKDI